MSKEEYQDIIARYQNASRIPLLVALDLEGYWNPLPFYSSKNFGQISSDIAAYELGAEHAAVMKELGFNLDFSPVVEMRNEVWPGRSFNGSPEEVNAKIKQYIHGVQSKGVYATAKHYPGGSMLRDPHKFIVNASITREDLATFDAAINANVSAVMIGHPIVTGPIDSRGRQSSVSPEVIDNLRKTFHGVIITDSIGMLGLRFSYLFRRDQLYVDLIKAGNDIILDTGRFFASPRSTQQGIEAVKKAVQNGEISEKRIDESVRRILLLKGHTVF